MHFSEFQDHYTRRLEKFTRYLNSSYNENTTNSSDHYHLSLLNNVEQNTPFIKSNKRVY